MRNRVERLRLWLLGSAVFLMLVIAVFIGSAHYLRQIRLKLPGKLGINITSETNNVTASHTSQNGTVYTIRASKQIEYANGKMVLRDASITLYGPKQNRADRIYGDQFEVDENSGVVRAVGVVHIDMQAADAANGGPAFAAAAAAENAGSASQSSKPGLKSGTAPKVLHVTTSGLVYMEKLGLAATSEPIDFQIGAMTGHATGADYNSDSGLLTLHSAVTMSGIAGNRPVALTAATAQLDSRTHETFLTHATYASLGRTATADQAKVYSRPDGTLERVEAQGNVTGGDKGATVMSQKADVALTAQSQPQSAVLTGDVRYALNEPLRQVAGRADVANIAFDDQAKPQPEHAVFTGGVRITERTRATEATREPWTVRDLTAAKFDAALVPAGEGRSRLQDAEATGNAHLTEVKAGSLAVPGNKGTTEVSGDDLKAHLIRASDAKQPPQIDTLAGRGHTVVRQVSAAGVEMSSAGDTLDAKFKPKPGPSVGGAPAVRNTASKQTAAGEQITELLRNAVQQGHVTVNRRAPAKTAAGGAAQTGGPADLHDDVERAMADRAVYDGDLDRVTLTDGVELTEAGSELWATQVALDHATGDVHALGKVQVDYVEDDSTQAGGARRGGRQGALSRSDSARASGAGTVAQGARSTGSPNEPTHILAERAELEHAVGIATFYGAPVRLWNGASQVQAPVIEMARTQKRMIARGAASTGWSGAAQAAQVHTILTRAVGDPRAGPAAGSSAACGTAASKIGGGKPAAQGSDVVRIASGGLIYSEILDQANFTGGFRADTVDGTIRANEGTAYLRPTDEGRGTGGGVTANGAAAGASGREDAGMTAGGVAPSGAAAGGSEGVASLAGSVDRIVATGHVDIVQPGMHATGERLVYTASDHVSLLTGDAKALPKAVDARGTTTTGAALRFHDTCDASGGVSVEALGGSGQRVRTDSRVSDVKKQKGKQ